MKKFLLAVLGISSLSAFSQSYLIMDNGITVTTDSSGHTYDFGHYAFPQKITLRGGQYFVEEGTILATIDENGLLFRKYELIPENIKGKGLNYFLSEEGVLYTIDKKGFVTITENEKFKKAVSFGGTYFTVDRGVSDKDLELYVITEDGEVVTPVVPSLKVKDIISHGGNYFMNNRGIVFTVSSKGEVTPHDYMRVGVISRKGGNFFVDSSGYLYTVSNGGMLKMPAIPVSFQTGSIHRMGSNYFLDLRGKLFVVDKEGDIFERPMIDHDFRNAKIISL